MSDTYGNLREQMVAATSSTGVKVSDLVAKPKLEQTMTVEAARDIWIAAVKCAESYSTPKGGAEYLKETLEFLRKELGQDESVLLGAFLSSGELSVEGKDGSGIKSGSELDVFDDAVTRRLRNFLGSGVNEMRRDTVDGFVDLLAELAFIKVIRKVQRELPGLNGGNDDLKRLVWLKELLS